MAYKTLGIVLAAGLGTRVKRLYTQNEPIKPMLVVHGKRLIDWTLQSLEGVVDSLGVSTYISPQHTRLDEHVQRNYPKVKVFHQPMSHKEVEGKIWGFLSLLYAHMQQDSAYFREFNSVLAVPCDVVLEKDTLLEVMRAHQEYEKGDLGIITMLSKETSGEGDRKYFLTQKNQAICIDNERVVDVNLCPKEGYSGSTQAGVWIMSTTILERDFGNVLRFWDTVAVYRHVTPNSWKDFGEASAIERARIEKK